MKLLRRTIRKLLTERMTNQAWSFFKDAFGFEQMSRREVPSAEQLGNRRDVYYGRYVDDDCQTIFQLEEREIYDFINSKPANVIWIHGIRSFPSDECQGKGMGTHVMNMIMDFADSSGFGVAGDVRPYGGSKMTQDDMKAFDARFGLMPLKHYLQYIDLDSMAEEEQYDIEDYVNDHDTWVWRPAEGSVQ